MTSTVINSDNVSDRLDGLVETLATGSLQKQLQAIQTLSTLEDVGEQALIDFLSTFLAMQVSSQVSGQVSGQAPESQTSAGEMPTAAHGSAYQRLFHSSSEQAQAFVTEKLPHGLLV
ncbi:MAG: hypothetical protein AAFO83_10380, partial [Cyanobacteria bacterium J06607_13]